MVTKQEPKHTESIYKCPKCKNIEMRKLVNKDGVVIDKCPKCEGIWLDKGEWETVKGISFFKYLRNWFR